MNRAEQLNEGIKESKHTVFFRRRRCTAFENDIYVFRRGERLYGQK